MTATTFDPSFPTTWERRLFALAHTDVDQDPPRSKIETDAETLQEAYAACDALTKEHSKTFYTASALMPPEKRRGVRALYAFCRISDDLVDHADPNTSTTERLAGLEAWRRRALLTPPSDGAPSPEDLPVLAWTDTMARYRVPARYAHQLIDGVTKDILKTRYASFDELAEYSYGVASTVGLMSMNVVGFRHEAAIPYAMRMGVALQLTNILRDVGEDWERGRLYLPREEMEDFGVREADVEASLVSDRWRALMRFQIERVCRLYAESWPGLALLARQGRLAIAAAADFYAAILHEIVAHDYDVFGRRAHLSGWAKVRRVPGLWWRTRQFNYARWMANASYPEWAPCPEP